MPDMDVCRGQNLEPRVVADCRNLRWHTGRLEAICDWIDGGVVTSRPATIQAFSTHGMALVQAHKLEPGVVVTVRMTTATDRVAFAKLGRIVHNQPEKLGDWLLGVVFLNPLTPEEVAWLLSPEAQENSTLFFEI